MPELTLLFVNRPGARKVDRRDRLPGAPLPDDKVKGLYNQLYGAEWEWVTITAREPLYGDELAVTRACTGKEGYDPLLRAQKQFVQLVTGITGRPVSEDAFAALQPPKAQGLIDEWLGSLGYAGVAQDPDFFDALKRLQAELETANPSPPEPATPAS